MEADAKNNKATPADFLRLILGKTVRVKLSQGLEYTGLLLALDETMNVVLEKAEEFRDGKLSKKYEEVFLRGNNGKLLLTQCFTSTQRLSTSRVEQLAMLIN